jgi:ferredoxin-type protein NapF
MPTDSPIAGTWTRREVLLGGLPRLARRLAEQASAPAPPAPVRPPGALAEAAFLATCERCHACVAACPNHVLAVVGKRGDDVDGTPYMAFHGGYCELCRACADTCPSGALQREVTGTAAYPGIAVAEMAHCLNKAGFAMCISCQDRCPERAISLVQLRTPTVVAERCTGCGACQFVCPTSPAAIAITPLPRPITAARSTPSPT